MRLGGIFDKQTTKQPKTMKTLKTIYYVELNGKTYDFFEEKFYGSTWEINYTDCKTTAEQVAIYYEAKVITREVDADRLGALNIY